MQRVRLRRGEWKDDNESMKFEQGGSHGNMNDKGDGSYKRESINVLDNGVE